MAEELKDRIKKERLQKKLNQPQLAKLLNVSKQTVSNWENGNRTPETSTVIKLAKIFDVSTDYLLGKVDHKQRIENLLSDAGSSVDLNNNTLFSKFSSRFKELREEQQLTYEQLSNILKVSQNDIIQWENGNIFPNEETLKEIADYFKVTFDYLFGRTDNSKGKIYEFNVGGHNIKAIVEEPDNNINEEEFKRELLQKLIKEYL